MKTFLAVLGAINLIIIIILLAPIWGIAYVLLAPLILLIVIGVALIKKLYKPSKKKEE